MIQKANIRPAWVVLLLLLAFTLVLSLAQTDDQGSTGTPRKGSGENTRVLYSRFKNAEENENCLKCHGQSKYQYVNAESQKLTTRRMYAETIIHREEFYVSNHREFKCTDCHSEDYSAFPHPGNLRMETIANCIDCHGGDEHYAKFQFEKIDTAFMKSVHFQKHSDEFTCWMCHDPHTYKINARTTENLTETLSYDNTICLNCHDDADRYRLLTDKQKPDIIKKHEWLPNQESHFTKVRCIECHSRNEDTLIVSHYIVPKKMAVRKCEDCHAKNSILTASLYKYQVKEAIQKEGLFKGLLLNGASTVGPDKNNALNIISFIIIGLLLLVIAGHAALRFKNK